MKTPVWVLYECLEDLMKLYSVESWVIRSLKQNVQFWTVPHAVVKPKSHNSPALRTYKNPKNGEWCIILTLITVCRGCVISWWNPTHSCSVSLFIYCHHSSATSWLGIVIHQWAVKLYNVSLSKSTMWFTNIFMSMRRSNVFEDECHTIVTQLISYQQVVFFNILTFICILGRYHSVFIVCETWKTFSKDTGYLDGANISQKPSDEFREWSHSCKCDSY